ncbi:CBS domain-containing protein [Listeria booriae]|uniref:CBS-HotDog domain-containing transcription factor YtoI n=1 Tax=Listeria booriae TaxID=1552123 RepID=UPI0016246210|nr:CBS-HotDog domain-containing transcription factor YtoI [Listeria booriae]MBC1503498.1 CBS domain-containing protein [Listeria booriae]MBC1522861.1 CBS domain-containing protein [Listeria booriae]MBC1529379.1 CBS domain-containing protein [Listeria booriae]MBC6134025.1 CBS domain-containing protein [Listeria booriae]
MATKHEQILKYIEELAVGEKISVRKIAKNLQVSEGTAYRAIKDAEIVGFVSTIKRVGTIRIERKQKDSIEKLTYAEIVNMIDGQVLGGRAGLHKSLNKFVIGAMTLEAMERYTDAGNLVIVGNRVGAQELALERGAAVLITGGFDTDDSVKQLADEKELPILSTTYDTFTVATMINRAIFDQLIKKEVVFVEDILTPIEKTAYLVNSDRVEDWYKKETSTGHSRFPVVNKSMRLLGMITSKDVIDKNLSLSLERVMTKNPLTVGPKMSVASVSHMMIWEGIEVIPVVKDDLTLIGIVSRQDILKSLQMIQRQPQIGETIDDTITNQLLEKTNDDAELDFQFTVTPQMTNNIGTLSYGVFTQIVCDVVQQKLFSMKKRNVAIENISIYFLKPVQMDATIVIKPRILEIGRKAGKIDVELYLEGILVGKAIVACQMMER